MTLKRWMVGWVMGTLVVIAAAACGPEGYVFHPPEETQVFVPVPGDTEVITVTVTDTTAVNTLIRIIEQQVIVIEKKAKEAMWLRQALEEIARIECAPHEHAHRADVCDIARAELARAGS